MVSEVGDIQRFPSGAHVASFLGLTTSKHISGTTLFQRKRITKQGSPNGRYAAVNMALHLSQLVPKYQAMYKRIKDRKPPRKGHFVALVAIARDFVTNVLYDMWRYQRPFFLEVDDYRAYRRRIRAPTTSACTGPEPLGRRSSPSVFGRIGSVVQVQYCSLLRASQSLRSTLATVWPVAAYLPLVSISGA